MKWCRYVKGTSPLDITVTTGRLRWHRNQSHTCAPLQMKQTVEVLHLFRCSTHTHRYSLSLSLYIYIYTCNIHLCYFFGLLAKSTKYQPLKIKKAPLAVFLSKKSVLRRSSLSHISSDIPSCDSNATTVGDCLCLLLAPNQRLKSVHDMLVWDKQVARMVWKRAKLLKTRKPMKPKAGEVGGMVLVSKNSEPDLNLIMCVACAHVLPLVWYLKNLEWRNWKWVVSQLRQITPFSWQITPLTRQITPLKTVRFSQKWNFVMPYLIIAVIRWSHGFAIRNWSCHKQNCHLLPSQQLMASLSCHDNRVVPGKKRVTRKEKSYIL